jgi:hypothetical protein
VTREGTRWHRVIGNAGEQGGKSRMTWRVLDECQGVSEGRSEVVGNRGDFGVKEGSECAQ